MKRTWRAAPGIALGVAAAAVLVRLTLRDRVPGVSTFFYATPLAVVTGLCLLAGLAFFMQRRRVHGRAALALGLLALLWWACASLRWTEATPAAPGAVRMLFWNAFRGKAGWEMAARRIPFADLDLVALVEAGKPTSERLRFWASHASGMVVRGFPNHTWLMARGPIEKIVVAPRYRSWRIHVARVALSQGAVTVVIVDLPSALWRSRKPAFQALYRVLDALPSLERVMVVGDFNTPRESVFMEPIRRQFSHAFETAGRGLIDTWPVLLPCLSIDHVWLGPGLEARRCEHRSTLASDHRQVYVEFGIVPRP